MKKDVKTIEPSLLELEKQIRKVIRKSLKDNTLDYTVQFTVSSLEPNKVKYAAQISSPANGIQPITFIFDSLSDLKNSLIEAELGLDKKKVELVFHESRIKTYESKIQAHKERMVILEAGEEEPEEDIPMEQV